MLAIILAKPTDKKTMPLLEDKLNSIAQKEKECGFMGVSFSVKNEDETLKAESVIDYVMESLDHAEKCLQNIDTIPTYKDGEIIAT